MKVARAKLDRYEIEDLLKIENALSSYGIILSKTDIALAWEEYSAEKETQWLKPEGTDEEIYLAIIEHLILEDW